MNTGGNGAGVPGSNDFNYNQLGNGAAARPQNNRPINIQPAQATRLVQELKNELALAKAAGDERVAQQHYSKAESIKQVLLRYQAQQRARQQQQQQAQGSTPGQLNPSTPSAAPQQQAPQNRAVAQTPATNLQAGSQAPRQGTPGAIGGAPNNQISVENFNQVKARLISLDSKIKQLKAAKESPTLTPEQSTAIDTQLNDLKVKYAKCQKIAIIIRDQLLKRSQGNASAAGSPNATGLKSASPPQLSPATGTPILLSVSQNDTQPPLSANLTNQTATQQPSQPTNGDVVGKPPSATTTPNTAIANAAASGKEKQGTPTPASKPVSSSSSSVNLSGITKPSVPSIPISSSINVKPPLPVVLKPGNNSRATLTGGSANGLGQIVGTPSIVKMPTFDLATTGAGGPIPDSGGRVLTKRKLAELVNTIGADEGDGATGIDGDVEELLLDLADEFITSVTNFACRLAKHRKVDAVDVRDVQLHLEKNWNIRVPGYAMDEIRATRKWQPSSSYNQKVSGVEIAKSVDGNIS